MLLFFDFFQRKLFTNFYIGKLCKVDIFDIKIVTLFFGCIVKRKNIKYKKETDDVKMSNAFETFGML
jgi:hypothetical protein